MSRFLSDRFSNIEPYTPGEQLNDKKYIKLNTNESPFPPAPLAQQYAKKEAEKLQLYSDPQCRDLIAMAAQKLGVAENEIIFTNGSDEVLNFAFMAFGGSGVIFPEISYGFYEVYAELYRLDYEKIPLEADFALDYQKYCGKHKMVVIANPNAPTGLCLTVQEIEGLLQENPDHVVIVDEAYVDFGGTSCYTLIETYENLLVVRTFSKSRCLAGARLGYAFGSPALIEDLEKLKYSTNPYNVNRLTMLLGCKTVEAEPYYQEVSRKIQSARAWAVDALKAQGFEVLPSKANFIFARHPEISGDNLYKGLRQRGILVRHFTKERIKDFVRITIGTQAQMECLVDALKEMTGGVK